MPIKWDSEADRKLLILVLKLHQIKLDYKTLAKEFGDDVTPSSIKQHLRKIVNSTSSDDAVPDGTASLTSDNGEYQKGEGSKEKPAKKPRVKATSTGARAKRGRKRKADSAPCAPTQEKEGDYGKDGTAMGYENENTHEIQGEVEHEEQI